jgi:hypothetical protein
LTEGSTPDKEKHPGGRPSKLTPELTDKLCNLISLGLSYKTACRLAGISYNAFNLWIKEAEENENCEEKYLEFFNQIRASEEKPINLALTTILNAIEDGNVNAAQWYAERRCKEDFGKNETIDLKNQHSGGVTLNLTRTSCRKEDVQSSE